ncbi:hypothetical protein BKA91DRAFT_138017, partial [Yarrowia lipolytica]
LSRCLCLGVYVSVSLSRCLCPLHVLYLSLTCLLPVSSPLLPVSSPLHLHLWNLGDRPRDSRRQTNHGRRL